MSRNLPARFAAVSVLVALPAMAMDHDEIVIGRTAAGQLKADVAFPQPVLLPASVFPGVPGWAFAVPGFASLEDDEPGEDHFTLDAAANVEFVLVSAESGVQVWNDNGSAPLAPGQSFLLGSAPFDVHPLWNITSGAPGQARTVTLKLHDTAGVYTDSDTFTVSVAPSRISLGCRADADHDFVITPADVAAFVNSWIFSLTIGALLADYDGNGIVEPADLAVFVNDWFYALGNDC